MRGTMLPDLFLLPLLYLRGLQAGPAEHQLISRLLEQGQEYNPLLHPGVPQQSYLSLPYNPLERPVIQSHQTVPLEFGMALQQIVGVDEKAQILTSNIWLQMKWQDPYMTWNVSEHNNIKDIRLSPERLWKPDILLHNAASENFNPAYQSSLIVYHNGDVEQIPPGIFQSTCQVDMTWFPFDTQNCSLKFGSWTYHEAMLNLTIQGVNPWLGEADLSSYKPNAEWDLVSAVGRRHVEVFYGDGYVDVMFSIVMRRRTLYYFTNLIGPCVLIASMVIFGFQTPPDSGEKLTLCITILMSLTFFLNMVSAMQPPSSNTPLIGTYFSCIMVMVACSVVTTVLILNFHKRTVNTHEMPHWVETVFLQWLPWLLRMERPGQETLTATNILLKEKMRELELGDSLPSRSLEPDLLDGQEDFLTHRSTGNSRYLSPLSTSTSSLSLPTLASVQVARGRRTNIEEPPRAQQPSAMERELQAIQREIVTITEKIRRDGREGDIAGEWKYAAMVMDRLCLVSFLLFTLLLSAAVFLSAPHIIVR